MNLSALSSLRTPLSKALLLDAAAIAVIYLAPAFAHQTGIPVYMIEPMRLMMVLALAHSSRINAYALALTLPVFSWIISGHPEFLKMLIITGELTLNVWLFHFLTDRKIRTFQAMALAIIVSKAACYLAYWPLFSLDFVMREAAPHFLLIQTFTTLIFAIYIATIKKPTKS